MHRRRARRSAIVAAATCTVSLGACAGASPGPLQAVPCCSQTKASVRAGRPFQLLVFPLANTSGSDPLTLRKVELVNPSPGVRLLGVYALQQGGTEVIDPRFPAARARGMKSFDGYVIPPQSGPGRSIDAALRLVAEPGPQTIGGVAVEYESGGASYRQVLQEGMSVCATGPIKHTNTSAAAKAGRPGGCAIVAAHG